MRAVRTLAALLLMGAATVAYGVIWNYDGIAPVSERESCDCPAFQVPLNNAWGAQSYDYLQGMFPVVRAEHVHVVFSFDAEVGEELTEVRYARSDDGGATFPQHPDYRKWISDVDDDDEAYTPTIAAWGLDTDAHDVLVAHYDDQELSGTERQSILSRRNNRQGLPAYWSSYRNVSLEKADSLSERPSMALCRRSSASDGKYYQYVVWEDKESTSAPCIRFFRDNYTQGGTTVSATFRTRLTLYDGRADRNPSVAAVLNPANDSNHVYVVWYGDSASNGDEVWFKRSTCSGKTWKSKVNLSNTLGYHSQAPCIAATGSYVYVVWQEEDTATGRFYVRFRRSTNYGANWDSVQRISDDLMAGGFHNLPPECFAPSIACYQDYVYVVCQAGWDWYTVAFMMSFNNGVYWTCEGLSTRGTDEEPDLDYGLEGLFPTVSVSQGDGQLEWKYLNILFRAWDDDEDYQVYYLRGDRIYEMPGGGGDQAGARVPVRRLNVRPSIVKSETRIDLELTRQGVVDLSVYDVQGRQVRCLGKGLLPKGWYHASWDGRDEAGRRQSAGAYLVVLKTESGVMTRRIQLVGE